MRVNKILSEGRGPDRKIGGYRTSPAREGEGKKKSDKKSLSRKRIQQKRVGDSRGSERIERRAWAGQKKKKESWARQKEAKSPTEFNFQPPNFHEGGWGRETRKREYHNKSWATREREKCPD